MKNQINELRRHLIVEPSIWQHDLLSPKQLGKLAKDKGLKINDAKLIEGLWTAAFIRADIVKSKKELHDVSLKLVHKCGKYLYYVDERNLVTRDEGYGSFLKGFESDTDIELFFHPFRLYPLYQTNRVFDTSATPIQYLTNSGGLIKVAELEIECLDSWTCEQTFCDLFDYWNRVSELAVISEPASYQTVFHSIRWKHPDTKESTLKKLYAYEARLDTILSNLEVQPIEAIRRELCSCAEIVDGNKILHVLLRLTSWHKQQSLKSNIGASMFFLSMAEIIRRSVERAHKIELPEEDELGFGQWFSGARKTLYGSERVLDAPRTTIRDFMAGLHLDYGPKVRCYVEGETELGAIKHAVNGFNGIEVVNLRGQVIEKRGRGVSFRDALKNDAESNVFSFVFLDGDIEDNIRAVKKAADDDIFCGRFFISKPDFEFQNFDYEELVEIVIAIAEKQHLNAPNFDILVKKKTCVGSAREFFSMLKDISPNLSRNGKSEEWGEILMEFALQSSRNRPCVDAVKALIMATKAKYRLSREKLKVDAITGNLIDRA